MTPWSNGLPLSKMFNIFIANVCSFFFCSIRKVRAPKTRFTNPPPLSQQSTLHLASNWQTSPSHRATSFSNFWFHFSPTTSGTRPPASTDSAVSDGRGLDKRVAQFLHAQQNYDLHHCVDEKHIQLPIDHSDTNGATPRART